MSVQNTLSGKILGRSRIFTFSTRPIPPRRLPHDNATMLAEPAEKTVEREEPCPLPKWEISGSDFAIFVALLFSGMAFFSILLGQAARWYLDPAPGADLPLLASLAENIGMQLGMLIAFVAFGRIQSLQDAPKPSGAKLPLPAAALTGLKWLMIAYPTMIAINLVSRAILNQLGYEQVVQDPIRMVQEGGTTFELGLMYSMIVLVAPLCEELVFRAGIFRYLHHRMPLFLSIGLSAFLFALLHANLYSFAPLMTIGVMLAFAYRQSGSIVSAVVFHSIFNTINLLLIIVFPDIV